MVSEINQRYLAAVDGFECVGTATNASSAWKLLQQGEVDLVLLDIFMPGTNGLALLADLRKENTSVDVIVITAASDMTNIKTALRLGAVDYLIKPFEFERFNAALKLYAADVQRMAEQIEMNQAELDRVLLRQDHSNYSGQLPKGLTKETLQRTIEEVLKLGSTGFSTEELAGYVGVSRVSMRKYITFLEQLGFISSHLNYQTSGRPQYKYILNKGNTNVINNYLL